MPLSLMLDEGKFNQVMVIQLFALSFFFQYVLMLRERMSFL